MVPDIKIRVSNLCVVALLSSTDPKSIPVVVRSTALHDSSSGSSWTVEGASLCFTSSIMEIS